jgi:heat shock protein HslJ
MITSMSALRLLRPRLAPAAGVSALLGAVLLVAACGGSEDGDGGSAVGDAPDLAGKTFVSTGSTGYDLVEGTAVSLTFADRLISANAGCNTLNGAATWTGGVLTVAGDALASTQMMCPEPLMRQDAWLTRFLTSGPAVTLTGAQLLLKKDDVSLTLKE